MARAKVDECSRTRGFPIRVDAGRRGWITVILLVAALVACSGNGTGGKGSDAAHRSGHNGSGGSMPGMGSNGASVLTADRNTPRAVQLRSGLELLLGGHALLMVELMRDEARAGPAGRTQAALDAVQRNTSDLTAAIRQLYGAGAAVSFEELWSAHVKRLSDYAIALAAADADSARSAQQELITIEGDLAGFLSKATSGVLSETTARSAVRMHIEMLLDQARAYVRGDYRAAFELEARGFEHMTMLADTLARAMATAKNVPVGVLDSPRRQLQSALARLFAQHMGLMVEAMRADVDRSPDFRFVGDSLNANTTALGSAVAALYGQDAESAFLKLWAQHVDALIHYSDATVQRDEAGKSAAVKSLNDFTVRLAAFLATATQERLPAIQLTGALTDHDVHLAREIDDYSKGRFAQAEFTAADGYAHMFTLAQALATAIGNTVASRLPKGGLQTGGGGTATDLIK